jgi:DNA-3-methyladenine glycosylase II
LAVAFGAAFDNGDGTVYAFPRPSDLVELNPSDLRRLGFSHQKGKAMIELARSMTEGHLDLEHFAGLSDDEAVKRLCELRGVGRWTAEYVLLRGLGRTHVFPGDDVGARNNLRRWLGITTPLDYESIREQLSPFGQYAGLVYFHLLLNRLSEAGELGANDLTAKARKGTVLATE